MDLSKVAALLLERFAPSGTAAIEETTSLVESGWLDSFAIVEVVAFLEREYGVRLADRDVIPRNFETLASIRRLLARAGAR
jgi:acyl carrier protein